MSWDCGVVAVEDEAVKTPSSPRERKGKDIDSVRHSEIGKYEFVSTQNCLILALSTHFNDMSAKTRLTVKAVRFCFVSSMKRVPVFRVLRTQPLSGWVDEPMSGITGMAADPFTII